MSLQFVEYGTATSLQSSAKNCDEQSRGTGSPSPPPNTRRARDAIALDRITALQNRRVLPGGLARGVFPSGQTVPGDTPSSNYESVSQDGSSVSDTADPSSTTQSTRQSPARLTNRASAPPQGQMIRGPSTLRVTRAAGQSITRGRPNLKGRQGTRPQGEGARKPGNRSAGGPAGRERPKGEGSTGPQRASIADTDVNTMLSDAMALQMLRVQRKQWDPRPYEPKYGMGSFAVNELIHVGRELFRGQSPPVKIWGRGERRIGVVGMHGAEAELKIRRIPDGDAAPFGQEELLEEEAELRSSGKGQKTRKERSSQEGKVINVAGTVVLGDAIGPSDAKQQISVQEERPTEVSSLQDVRAQIQKTVPPSQEKEASVQDQDSRNELPEVTSQDTERTDIEAPETPISIEMVENIYPERESEVPKQGNLDLAQGKQASAQTAEAPVPEVRSSASEELQRAGEPEQQAELEHVAEVTSILPNQNVSSGTSGTQAAASVEGAGEQVDLQVKEELRGIDIEPREIRGEVTTSEELQKVAEPEPKSDIDLINEVTSILPDQDNTNNVLDAKGKVSEGAQEEAEATSRGELKAVGRVEESNK